MALITAVDFDAGPAGAQITSANTPAINGAQSGTEPVFDSDIPSNYTEGDFSAKVDLSGVTSFNNATFSSQPAIWIGFYFTLLAASAADAYWMNWYSVGGTKVGDLKWTAGGQTIGIRDNNTVRATSPTLALGTWHRAAVQCTPNSATGHRLKIYTGANLHGSTPDYDSGGQTATSAGQTDVGGFRFGLLAGAESHYKIARVRIETTEPAPITVAADPDMFWLDTDGLWKPSVVFHSTASGWV